MLRSAEVLDHQHLESSGGGMDSAVKRGVSMSSQFIGVTRAHMGI